jgi:RimJ/RimL family protein N-acetyltransferase
LGYWLGKPYWGHGFMTEAVGAVLRVVFQNEETQRMVAVTDIDNTASQNVLRKIGFRYLGLIARPEPALRGSAQVTSWQLDRRQFLIGQRI